MRPSEPISGTQQHLRAFLFGGEVGGGAVALDDRQPFVEHRGADRFTLAQHLLQLQRGVGLGADHQHFFVAVGQQVVQQPLDARVEVPPGGVFAFEFLVDLLRIQHVARARFDGLLGAHDAGDFDRGLILGRQRQLDLVQVAVWEALHAVAGVAEQHAAGAVAIHQHGHQLLARLLGVVAFAVGRFEQRFDVLLVDQLAQQVQLVVGQAFTAQQQGDGVGHRAVFLLLGDEIAVVVETARIEQAQAREVALLAQLLRGGGQQQHAGDMLGQLFDHLIFAARRFFAPGQVVRFVDHQQIPLGVRQLFQALLVAAHEVQRADHQLLGFERVAAVELGFGVAAVVEQREVEVEAAHHLHQPLVLQRFRHHD